MGIGILIVVSGSMEPTINIKELVVIKEQNNYEIRDIVTYRDNTDNLVTHRIVSRVENTIITRGDNNTVSDNPIDIQKVEGIVCYHSLVLGEFFLYWIKPLLILIILLLMINTVKSIIITRRRKVNEEKV